MTGQSWKRPEDVRTARLTIYLTHAEKERIEMLARRSMRAISDYVRLKALNGRSKPEHAKLQLEPDGVDQ